MAFPTLSLKPSGIIEEHIDPQEKSPFESGTTQVAKKFTRKRMAFQIGYKLLRNSDKILIENHSDTYKGTSFIWTHPLTGTDYTVVYSNDAIVFEYVAFDGEVWWKTDFRFEEP